MTSTVTPRQDRLIVVSNRLPFAFQRDDAGRWRAEPGSGGLVTALLPVMRHRGGMWIGWPGAADDSPELSAALAAVNQSLSTAPAPPGALLSEQVRAGIRIAQRAALGRPGLATRITP